MNAPQRDLRPSAPEAEQPSQPLDLQRRPKLRLVHWIIAALVSGAYLNAALLLVY